jgi:hypothetical protein
MMLASALMIFNLLFQNKIYIKCGEYNGRAKFNPSVDAVARRVQ